MEEELFGKEGQTNQRKTPKNSLYIMNISDCATEINKFTSTHIR